MGLSRVLLGVAGVAAGAAILCNLPTNPFVPTPVKATLPYLSGINLKTIEEKPKEFKEAQGLSSLKLDLDAQGVALHAVVHETLGVKEFRPFFKGDVFLDKERKFYGPTERWMLFSALLRAKVWMNVISNRQSGVKGNMIGEGRLLGAVFVVGPGEQGILFEHREKEFGDYANLTDVMDAVKQIKQ